ncbi:MAG: hypothetical protein LLG04_11290 [Parachlamydia sp.]|nr:hypothetical protein [Parachlamydia sp.]
MTATESKLSNLIHIAKMGQRYLFLRKVAPMHFGWFWWDGDAETAAEVIATNAEEALRLAQRQWRQEDFRPVGCGFRYTLPERDEHGMNALFYQMVASYESPSGIYFDDELGGNCIVHFASTEARRLMTQLKSHDKAK